MRRLDAAFNVIRAAIDRSHRRLSTTFDAFVGASAGADCTPSPAITKLSSRAQRSKIPTLSEGICFLPTRRDQPLHRRPAFVVAQHAARPISARAQNCHPERSDRRFRPCRKGSAFCRRAAINRYTDDSRRFCSGAACCAPHLGKSAKLSSRAQRGICFLPTRRDQPLPPTTLDAFVVAQHAARSISARFLQIASAPIISS